MWPAAEISLLLLALSTAAVAAGWVLSYELATENQRAERVRLLYVGATRARDYLVLATPASATSLPWLDELRCVDGAPAVAMVKAGAATMSVGGNEHHVRAIELTDRAIEETRAGIEYAR